MEPRGWCPLVGGNPESSAPLEGCRQEVESLINKEEKTKSRQVSFVVAKEKGKKAKLIYRWISPGIWKGLPGSELDGE